MHTIHAANSELHLEPMWADGQNEGRLRKTAKRNDRRRQ